MSQTYRPVIDVEEHPQILEMLNELVQLENRTNANGIVTRVLAWALPLELEVRRKLSDPVTFMRVLEALGEQTKHQAPVLNPQPPKHQAPLSTKPDISNPLAALEILKQLD